jgi:CRISPR-associated protein Csy3
MANSNLKTASVLAFERKLDPSDALFSSGQWVDRENGDSWPFVKVREKSVRGTISNRLKEGGQDPAKLDASIQNPNLQTVDVAALPSDADTLRVRFTLRVLPGAGVPSSCNDSDYQEKLNSVVQKFIEEQGFGELSYRYAFNLANGRFLWRNRIGAEEVEVRIGQMLAGKLQSEWIFNALNFPLRIFEAPEDSKASLSDLASVIEKGFAGKDHVLLEVIAYARIGEGQEVYPSQELILDQGQRRGQKSKTLYTVNGAAGLHSQKVGNALRTIDTWYQKDEDFGPIAVEPYGSVTSKGKAYRQPQQKNDFYHLLDNWLLRDKPPEKDQQHFVMATLIRGGVFGEAEKE